MRDLLKGTYLIRKKMERYKGRERGWRKGEKGEKLLKRERERELSILRRCWVVNFD